MYFISDILHHIWFVCMCVCICDVRGMWAKKKKRSWLRLFYSSVEIVLWVFGSYINRIFDLFFSFFLFFLLPKKHPDDDKHRLSHTHTHTDTEGLLNFTPPETPLWSGGGSVTPRRHGAVYVNVCLAQSVYSLSYLKKQIISGSAPLPSGTCSSFTEIILSVGWARGSARIRKRVKKNNKNLCVM